MTTPRLAIRQRLADSRERGSTAIQMVILMPALFTLMFLGVQAAVLYQGRTLALAAAQDGARDAATENGTAADGINTARSYLSSSTAGLTGIRVTGNRGAGQAQITVTANTLSLIPGWRPTVTQSATSPVERVTGG